jgi:hypothetical protein
MHGPISDHTHWSSTEGEHTWWIFYTRSASSLPLGVYNALATREGLCGWWTKDTQWDGKVGSVISFRFGDRGFIDVKVR